jgi:spore coat polysaccharide biosynthesis protein SpsF (cytidylyltransferase family)
MKAAEPGDQVDFTIDKEWDYRKVQSFRTAVRNHAIEFWGADNFVTTYDKENGVVTAVRSEARI